MKHEFRRAFLAFREVEEMRLHVKQLQDDLKEKNGKVLLNCSHFQKLSHFLHHVAVFFVVEQFREFCNDYWTDL